MRVSVCLQCGMCSCVWTWEHMHVWVCACVRARSYISADEHVRARTHTHTHLTHTYWGYWCGWWSVHDGGHANATELQLNQTHLAAPSSPYHFPHVLLLPSYLHWTSPPSFMVTFAQQHGPGDGCQVLVYFWSSICSNLTQWPFQRKSSQREVCSRAVQPKGKFFSAAPCR